MGHVPHGYWQTTTFIGALRTTGLTAPLVLDGPLTTEAFRAYVTQLLCPTLHPGDLVVLDNLAVHKDPVSAQHIAQTGATLVFLPPYSPDLNPIELVFAKLKALARGAAKRTRDTLWTYLGTAVARFSPHECQRYFRHCGYT
jgi:transposase